MLTTLSSIFRTIFDRNWILERARQLRAVQRVRALHPQDVLLAMVRGAVGDEHPGIATARRQFQDITGYMPEESSFYERLTPELAQLAWEMFLRTLARANRAQRREIARALRVPVRDVRVVDASSVTLPRRAAAHFPATDSRVGGFKLTTTLSLLEDFLCHVCVTDARQHDRKAFGLPSDVGGILWILDRGYSDHRLFAHIDAGGGYFLVRLKSTSIPIVTAIRSGLGKRHVGKPLDRDLPFRGVVDLDARFKVARKRTRIFRVVGIPVAENKQGEPGFVWLATNLPMRVAAGTVGAFYRARWTIENLFRTLKSVGRVDEVRSGKPAVVHTFIATTLIGLVISQAICAAMRLERRCEPSLHRVFALLLANLGRLFAKFAESQAAFRANLRSFEAALWREGVNPNPGRPYAARRHLFSVGK